MATENNIVTAGEAEGQFMRLINEATNSGNAEVLKQLGEMYKMAKQEQAEQAFRDAFVAMQSALPRIEKRNKVAFPQRKGNYADQYNNSRSADVKYAYAALEDVVAAVGGCLAEHGFSYSHDTQQIMRDMDIQKKDKYGGEFAMKGEGVVAIEITCTLTHVGGHSKSVKATIPIDYKQSGTDAQIIGGALTYGRRYTLLMALGVNPVGEDWDGGHDEPLATDLKKRIEDCNDVAQMQALYREAVQLNDYQLVVFATNKGKKLKAERPHVEVENNNEE